MRGGVNERVLVFTNRADKLSVDLFGQSTSETHGRGKGIRVDFGDTCRRSLNGDCVVQ